MTDNRWAHLAQAGFRLDALSAPTGEDVCREVDSLLECFDARLDPVDEFEAATLRRFLLSLRRALTAPARDAP